MHDLTIRFSGVAALAKALGLPITVFDLEGTGFRGPTFGITEVCCFTVTLRGNGVVHTHLIDPERPIDPRVSQLTGITQSMVRGKETWGHRYAKHFQDLAKTQWVAGFNIKTFDCPAVLEMNERYGFSIEEGFPRILDVRQLYLTLEKPESKKGKLGDIAEFYGITPQGHLHRAEADVILTLETLDAMVEGYGVQELVNALQPSEGPPKAKARSTPKATRPATATADVEKLVAAVQEGAVTSVEALAERLGIEVRAASFELGKAIDERRVNPLPFVNEVTLEWLKTMLVEVPTQTLVEGRLKPIYEYLTEHRPEGLALDYLQLRIGMMECGLTWSTLKPTGEAH